MEEGEKEGGERREGEERHRTEKSKEIGGVQVTSTQGDSVLSRHMYWYTAMALMQVV